MTDTSAALPSKQQIASFLMSEVAPTMASAKPLAVSFCVSLFGGIALMVTSPSFSPWLMLAGALGIVLAYPISRLVEHLSSRYAYRKALKHVQKLTPEEFLSQQAAWIVERTIITDFTSLANHRLKEVRDKVKFLFFNLDDDYFVKPLGKEYSQEVKQLAYDLACAGFEGSMDQVFEAAETKYVERFKAALPAPGSSDDVATLKRQARSLKETIKLYADNSHSLEVEVMGKSLLDATEGIDNKLQKLSSLSRIENNEVASILSDDLTREVKADISKLSELLLGAVAASKKITVFEGEPLKEAESLNKALKDIASV